MATVCKCDRCGKYVDEDVIPAIRGTDDHPTRVHPSHEIKMDLCPECYQSLREFLLLKVPDEEAE